MEKVIDLSMARGLDSGRDFYHFPAWPFARSFYLQLIAIALRRCHSGGERLCCSLSATARGPEAARIRRCRSTRSQRWIRSLERRAAASSSDCASLGHPLEGMECGAFVTDSVDLRLRISVSEFWELTVVCTQNAQLIGHLCEWFLESCVEPPAPLRSTATYRQAEHPLLAIDVLDTDLSADILLLSPTLAFLCIVFYIRYTLQYSYVPDMINYTATAI